MANSPKRDAAKALYLAIELVLHKECDKYTGDAKNVFRYHVQRHTAKLMPKLAKAAGMYANEKDIRVGDKLIHEAFGHGVVKEVYDDGFIAVDFTKAGPKKFVAKLALAKITRTKQGSAPKRRRDPKLFQDGGTGSITANEVQLAHEPGTT
jgi:hypothetical protein